MARQLTFDLPVRAAQGRDDFFVSPANAAAVRLLDDRWPGGRMVLVGPSGSGKSHLAQIWADDHGADITEAADLAQLITRILGQAQAALVVENIDRIAGQAAAEEALFHLLNAQAGQGGRLLLTTNAPASHLAIALPDLRSRLNGALSATLDLPDDSLLAALYVKHFSDRQIDVGADLIDFLVSRSERSFSAARSMVRQLDDLSLREQKPITRRMAARLLDIADETRTS